MISLYYVSVLRIIALVIRKFKYNSRALIVEPEVQHVLIPKSIILHAAVMIPATFHPLSLYPYLSYPPRFWISKSFPGFKEITQSV
jgi:hypothetical protein